MLNAPTFERLAVCYHYASMNADKSNIGPFKSSVETRYLNDHPKYGKVVTSTFVLNVLTHYNNFTYVVHVHQTDVPAGGVLTRDTPPHWISECSGFDPLQCAGDSDKGFGPLQRTDDSGNIVQ